MTISNILYTTIIGPLKLLFEVVYTLAYYVTGSAGLSIIFLSLAINILLLPLYTRADDIQNKQNEIEKKLKPGVDHIKKSFKGDERYMMTQAYYRENNYRPLDALKGSISLLLQIPFFMAAYDFLSNLNIVKGATFGPIVNLGSPDALITIGAISINILPVLMTLINIISSIIYTKGQPLKAKLQLYLMALAFLVFLYNRPSGLVFYWTLNNVFSLGKNIFNKLKHSKLILSILLTLISITGIIYLFINPLSTAIKQYGVMVILLLINIPLLLCFITKNKKQVKEETEFKDNKSFIISTIFLALFIGLYIPTNVIGSSPSEFVDSITLTNPITYIVSSLCLGVGTFIIWFNVYYLLMPSKVKRILNVVIVSLCLIVVIDYLGFEMYSNKIDEHLKFESDAGYSTKLKMLSVLPLVVVPLFVIVLDKFKIQDKLKFMFIITSVVVIVLSSINCSKIYSVGEEELKTINSMSEKEKPTINLSRNGQNVVVIVLDRAISAYFPFIINEKPELQEQFAGFTYYPNTISYGAQTIYASPSLYGGYEYTPEAINKRDSESLSDKHNEALKVLPVLFSENDFDVTVCDPVYAGYSEVPDLSIFSNYPNIKAFNTSGMFELEVSNTKLYDTLMRNLYCYSIMRTSPVIVRDLLYNYGSYLSIDFYFDTYEDGISTQKYVRNTFVDAYEILKNLGTITDIKDTGNNYFWIHNSATHEGTLLSEPDYIPMNNVDNSEYDNAHKIRKSITGEEITFENAKQAQHYQINAASLIQVGKWLDYLRENNVYDNTKIIVVSDHGYNLNQFEDLLLNDEIFENDLFFYDVMLYNPLLLVKDFNSTEFTIDNTFMTTADVPSIIVNDVIDNSINPFTDNELVSENEDKNHKITVQKEWKPSSENKFDTQYGWLIVHDNIFDKDNWTIER